jgi:DNA-directed RNA polymerase II subunit RPB1
MCLALFRKISPEDLETMGLDAVNAHPMWMILQMLPVPPPPVRPSISVDGGLMRSEDDLTYKLADIIKANVGLRKMESEGAPGHIVVEAENLLQVKGLILSRGLMLRPQVVSSGM